MRAFDIVIGYFSPETILPATSIVATIAGVVLMLGRGTLRLVMRSKKRGTHEPTRIAAASKPHLNLREATHSRHTCP